MKKCMMLLLLVVTMMVAVYANGKSEQTAGGTPNVTAQERVTTIQWWDHYLPLAKTHQIYWDEFEKETGIHVDYTQYDPAKQSEALLLAYRNGKCPDVFSMTFSGNPEGTMYKEGWFAPLSVKKEDLPQRIQDSLFEGYTLFNGKVYSFPTMSPLNHNAVLWYRKSMMDQVVPQTYQELRTYAKKITEQSGGKVSGIILPLAFISRMDATILDLMQADGGPGEIDWSNGTYQYASQNIFDVFEFLTGLKDDGSVHASSVNLDMRQARERWAAGEAALLFDGCWNMGVIKNNFSTIIDDVGAADPVRMDASKSYMIAKNPPHGIYFVSSQSHAVDQVTKLLLKLTTDDYYEKLAAGMDQPPLNLEVVDKAQVHPTYMQVIDMFAKTMGYTPDPQLRNPAVAEVRAEMKDIHPTPAEILQGYYSGAITDWKAELVKFNEAKTKERNRAIEVVKKKGLNVSLNDWVFANWKQGESFTTNKYR